MALTADKKTEYREGVELAAPVAAATRIYAGALACANASGYAVPGDDAAALLFIGVAREHADNSGGDNGDKSVLLRRRGLFLMIFATAISVANQGDNVFLVDDESVDLAAHVTHKIFCGVIAEVVDANSAWVDIEPAIKQADVATHIADASGAHGATAISIADAGEHFDDDHVEGALQAVAKTIVIPLPRFTGWTKDGDDKAIAIPPIELPVPVTVKRAYVNLGTAPGSEKTLTLKLNTETLLEIADTDTQGDAADLDIVIDADTEFELTAGETSSGVAANCDVILVAELARTPGP